MFAMNSLWIEAVAFTAAFCGLRCIFALLAASNLRSMRVPVGNFWPDWGLLASVVILAVFRFIGLGLGLWFQAIGCVRPLGPAAYRR
jgi:hypothetical protein